jgi:hypothetical protein
MAGVASAMILCGAFTSETNLLRFFSSRKLDAFRIDETVLSNLFIL